MTNRDTTTRAESRSNKSRFGPALEWTEAEIEELAADLDIDALADAAETWQENAPDGFEGLLDARPARDTGGR